MEGRTAGFTVDVQGIQGFCPVGEAYAKEQIASKATPVLSCEGPCIRGDIARRAADLIVGDITSLKRACHGEAFYVPYSAMATWVKTAERVVMVDGCFLQCHGRVLKTIVAPEKVIHIDALPLYKKYNDIFLMDDVPEEERQAVAKVVADKILARVQTAG